MEELKMLDLGIIGLYLVVMLLVGVWFVKRIKNTDGLWFWQPPSAPPSSAAAP